MKEDITSEQTAKAGSVPKIQTRSLSINWDGAASPPVVEQSPSISYPRLRHSAGACCKAVF